MNELSVVEFGILLGCLGVGLLLADFIRHYNDWD